MELKERIEAAIDRVTSGHGMMRVPVDQTDPDVVLCDCLTALAAATARELELTARLTDWEEREGAVCPEDVGFEEFIRALTARAEKAERAAAAFLAKYDQLAPVMNSAFQMAAIHGLRWQGGDNWGNELAALRVVCNGTDEDAK